LQYAESNATNVEYNPIRKKNLSNMNKPKPIILNTDYSTSYSNKDYENRENINLIGKRLKIVENKNKKKSLYKISFNSSDNINNNINNEDKLYKLPSLLRNISSEKIKDDSNKKDSFNLMKHKKNFLSTNDFDADLLNNIRNKSKKAQLGSLKKTNNSVQLNFNQTNFTNNKFTSESNISNLKNNFRKTSFFIFSESLKLNKDKKKPLHYETSKNLINLSQKENLMKFEKSEEIDQKRLITMHEVNQNFDSNLPKNDNRNKFNKLSKDNNSYNNLNFETDQISFNNNYTINDKNKQYKKPGSNVIPKFMVDSLNKNNSKKRSNTNTELVSLNTDNDLNSNPKINFNDFKSNLVKNIGRFDRNKTNKKNDNSKSYYKNFISNSKNSSDILSEKSSSDEDYFKDKFGNKNNNINTIHSSNKNTLNIFDSPKIAVKSKINFDFARPGNKIFSFNSNFDGSNQYSRNNTSKNSEIEKTENIFFKIIYTKENISNRIPNISHFLALDKSKAFKFYSNSQNLNQIENYENSFEEDINQNHSSNLNNNIDYNNKNHYQSYLKRNNDIDCIKLKYMTNNDKMFIIDDFQNSHDINTMNFTNYNTENPIDFDTDLKRKTTEFSKNRTLRFYNIKPKAYFKLVEYNKKKINEYSMEESKKIELIEQIEKNKEKTSSYKSFLN